MSDLKLDLQKTQFQIDWLKQQLYLDCISQNTKSRTVKRGQVYYCELGTGIGSELQKRRPCVIYQNNIGNIHSSKTIVIPITHTYKPNLSCFVPVADKYDNNGNVILDGYINVTEIRAIDKARICDYICDIEHDEIKAADMAIAQNLDMYRHYKALENKYADKVKHAENLTAVLSEIKKLLNVQNNSEIITELKKLLDKSE